MGQLTSENLLLPDPRVIDNPTFKFTTLRDPTRSWKITTRQGLVLAHAGEWYSFVQTCHGALWHWRGIVWYSRGLVWSGMILKWKYTWYVMILERHGIVWYFGQVHRRRSAQRMRCETSNTAIDLCPGAAFYNDTHHPDDQFHPNFTPKFYVGRWSQLAVNAPRSECSAPWTGIWWRPVSDANIDRVGLP